jgi:hypothetical protein
MPPRRALKEVAAVLAKLGTAAPHRDDSVTMDVLDGDDSHLESAREQYCSARPLKPTPHRDA